MAKKESGDVEAERKYLGELLYDTAKYIFQYEKNNYHALKLLDESHKHWPDNEKVMAL